LISEIHELSATFFLKGINISEIPIGTRKIKIDIQFEKSADLSPYYNFRFWDVDYTDNASITAGFHKDHLTAVTNINFKIDINNKYLSREKLFFS